MTEEEAAKLNIYDAPLYWRVKAVGEAENAGDWTGAGEFQINKPFSMPTWAIYTLAVLGGLIFFVAGYFVGRRAAYYQ